MTDLLSALLGQDKNTFQELEQRRRELARDLAAASYLPGEYVLSGGAPSSYYFHPSLFMTRPTVLRRLVSVLATSIGPDVDRLAGSEPGSLPIVVGLALETGLPFVSLRSETRPGNRLPVPYGELHPGEKVLVIEDVVTSGRRAIAAADSIEAAGGHIEGLLCVVDRQEGAEKAIASRNWRFESLFTTRELVSFSATTVPTRS